MFQNKLNQLHSRITDDAFRYYFQWCALCSILGVVALIMSVMNYFTHKQLLMYATAGFSVICFVDLIVLLRTKRLNEVSILIFQAATLCLFTYFLITGGTEGFSPLWILLMPSCGMLLLGQKRGAITVILLLGIVIFLLWTPAGHSLLRYDYTPEFCMRFPVVYIAFFGVGAFFELVRSATAKEMLIAQAQLKEIAEHDALTQVHNRFWFYKTFEANYEHEIENKGHAMLLIDIDNFKQVNDTYGHDMGDQVLVEVAQGIRSVLRKDDLFCRWGGEEFLVFLDCADKKALEQITERIHNRIRTMKHEKDIPEELHITVSIGAVFIDQGLVLPSDEIFSMADDAAYKAKHQGKNRTVFYNASDHVA